MRNNMSDKIMETFTMRRRMAVSVLVAVRLIWTCLPQTGYIHPDEFFQSTEIVAGDILKFDVVRTWEFNSSQPIRSVVPLYVFLAPSFHLLKFLGHFCRLDAYLTESYSLVILPRLSLVLLGFVVDIWVIATSKRLGLNSHLCYAVYLTSYVVHVFFTRTFSNTIESFLFAALLYVVIRQKTELLETVKDKKFLREPAQVHTVWCANSAGFLIGVLITLGFFNRPTFLFFAFVPYVTWLLHGIQYSQCLDRKCVVSITNRCLNSLTGAVFALMIIIVSDSIYFGSLLIDEIKAENIAKATSIIDVFSNLTITPLNFIRFNMASENLAQHGIHSRFTHFCVNSLLLFGPLAVLAVWDGVVFLWGSLTVNRHLEVSTPAPARWLLLSYFFPLLMLSVFPHQEPRFLLPLLFPLLFTVCGRVFGGSGVFISVTWLTLNLIGCLLFGIFHQGGIVPCLSHLQKMTRSVNQTTHILFYHTYMPPKHLLLLKQHPPDVSTRNSDSVPSEVTVRLHDLQGSSEQYMYSYIDNIVQNADKRQLLSMWIASPASLDHEFCKAQKNFRFDLQMSFWPHLTLEDMPDVVSAVQCGDGASCSHGNLPCQQMSYLQIIQQSFSLNLYQVLTA